MTDITEEYAEQSQPGSHVIGLADDKKEFYKMAKTEISYSRDGDTWVINVGMAGVPNGRTFQFKLGEPYDAASIDGSPMKSVITAENDRFVEKHTGESFKGAEMDIVRWIEGGKMIVKTSCAGLSMVSTYRKL
ncbi:hypothetical protein ScPMuIL_010759 [Solemya velum]